MVSASHHISSDSGASGDYVYGFSFMVLQVAGPTLENLPKKNLALAVEKEITKKMRSVAKNFFIVF